MGDYLSYYQDATATEAYLGTARQRVSVRRHARLLDYAMHDGCNARVWVQVRVTSDTPASGITLYPLLVKDSSGSWIQADTEPMPVSGLETLRARFVTKVGDSTVLSDADFDKLVTASTAEGRAIGTSGTARAIGGGESRAGTGGIATRAKRARKAKRRAMAKAW